MSKERTLKQAQRDYEKVCDKLEQLNDRAFEFEQEIRFLALEEKRALKGESGSKEGG